MRASQSPMLDPRARHLLRTLIARYIRDGEPVGSKTLAQHAGLDVSPATIRNILADLEDIGLLSSPHTSAGRVPTAHGYRVFVDSLVQMQPPGEEEVRRLRAELASSNGTQSLLGSASQMLSAMSHFVGVVSAPRREQFAFRHIDFVPLDARRVLAILVFADNEVQNRVIEPRRAYEPAELERVANYLNAQFAGRALSDIRASLLRELRLAKNEMEQLLAHSVDLASEALVPADADDMVMAGQTRLMGVRHLSDLESAARAVRGLRQQARDPAAARTHHPGAGRAHLHRRGNRHGVAGRRLAGHRSVYRRRPGAGRVGGDRAQTHGLRPGDSAGADRRADAGRGHGAARHAITALDRSDGICLKRARAPTYGVTLGRAFRLPGNCT